MKKIILILTIFTISLFAGVKGLDVKSFEEMKKSGVPVVDIRTPEEWRETGIIEGSYPIMFFDSAGRYDLNAFLKRLNRLGIGKESPFILVCRSANRTKMLGNFLSDRLGYKKVYELEGGILNWKRHSKPLEPLKK